MYCPYCGTELKADARFCGGCGRTMAGVLATGGVSAGEGVSVTTGGTPATAGVPATTQLQNSQTVQQDQQTIAQNGKGNERRLGILLCVFAPVCWLLLSAFFLYEGFAYSNSSFDFNSFDFTDFTVLATIPCALPLTIVLLVAGLKEISLARKAKGVDKAGSYQFVFGIALITLAVVSLFSAMRPLVTLGYVWLFLSWGSSFGEHFWFSFSFPLYLSLGVWFFGGLLLCLLSVAGAIMLFVAASRKKKTGVSGNSFMTAAILILVSVVLGITSGFYKFWGGYSVTSYLLPMLSDLVFPIVIIILGAGMIPKKQRIVVTQTPYYNQQGIQVGYVQDAPSIGFAFLGFFIPLVGLILFLVWKDQFPLKAKSCGKGALIALIVGGSITVLTIIALVIAFVVMGL